MSGEGILAAIVIVLGLCGGVGRSIDLLKKSLERDSAKVQALLAEIRDKLGK